MHRKIDHLKFRTSATGFDDCAKHCVSMHRLSKPPKWCAHHTMCNRCVSPTEADIESFWHICRANQPCWWREQPVELFPRAQGPFIRREIDDAGYSREGASGRWGLVAGEWSLKYAMNNARSGELASKASFKGPWAKGQRCIIPAVTFDERNGSQWRINGGGFPGRMASCGALPDFGIGGLIRRPARLRSRTQC